MTKKNIRIRMYRVGFGDCFLVSIPAREGMEHILVDCGVHPRGDLRQIPAIVQHIFDETGGKLALVIATHAHQDHISGFATSQDLFRKFQVREVWLPWTEDPKNAVALELKAKQQHAAALVEQHFAAAPPPREVRQALDAILMNLKSNDSALTFLKAGMNGGEVRYISAKTEARQDVAGVTGLAVQFLGPPQDEKFLAQMDPPLDQRFLRATASGDIEADNELLPFGRQWTVTAEATEYYAAITERDKNLLAVAATGAEGLAFALDNVLNNTSVVALFRYGGQTMLFPGDAQYGSWASWVGSEAGAALAGVGFYKVAHHGSFNATPKGALEKMPLKGFSAMASTQTTPWASIPLPALMEAVAERSSGLVRSDSLTKKALSKVPKGFKAGEFWVDCFLPVLP